MTLWNIIHFYKKNIKSVVMMNSPVFILLPIFVSIHGVNGIYGGQYTYEGQFKYSVSIWYGIKFECGGGILTGNHILTAAFCVHRRPSYSLRVTPGKRGLYDPSSRRLVVENVILHPNYTIVRGSIDYGVHNIAVLKLTGQLEFSPTIQPIRLSTTNNDWCHCCVCEMAGWGFPSVNSPAPSENMKWTTAFLMRREECSSRGIELAENEYCAVDAFGVSVASQGDAGGLFICNGAAIGVITGSIDTTPIGGVTIVLLVEPYLPFIDDAISGRI